LARLSNPKFKIQNGITARHSTHCSEDEVYRLLDGAYQPQVGEPVFLIEAIDFGLSMRAGFVERLSVYLRI